jgi:hypothetical protein
MVGNELPIGAVMTELGIPFAKTNVMFESDLGVRLMDADANPATPWYTALVLIETEVPFTNPVTSNDNASMSELFKKAPLLMEYWK